MTFNESSTGEEFMKPDLATEVDSERDIELISMEDDAIPKKLRKIFEPAEADMDEDLSGLLHAFLQEKGIDPNQIQEIAE